MPDHEQALMLKVQEILHERQMARLEAARREAARDAALGGQRYHIQDREGGGEVKMMIHPAFYHYWGKRLGYQCWQDPQFCREFLRDNPFARVQSRSRNPRAGWRAKGSPIVGEARVRGNVKWSSTWSDEQKAAA